MLISLCPLFLSLSMIRKCHKLLPFRFFAIADVRTHSLLLGWRGRRPSPANFAGPGLLTLRPLPPPSPRKLSAGRERIYSAPGATNAPRSLPRRHFSQAQPGPDRRPLRSSPCSTHARSAAHSSASESVSPVCVVGRFPPLPTLCASTDSPTSPLKVRLTGQRRRFPAAFAEIKPPPKLTRTPLVCANQQIGSWASNASSVGTSRNRDPKQCAHARGGIPRRGVQRKSNAASALA